MPKLSDRRPSHVGIPRWSVPLLWAVGLLMVHVVLPWGLGLLSAHYGWFAGRPAPGNLLALLLVAVGICGILWTMQLHFVQTEPRIVVESTPPYLLLRGPYKFSRNPMYLSELVLWLGWDKPFAISGIFIAAGLAVGSLYALGGIGPLSASRKATARPPDLTRSSR